MNTNSWTGQDARVTADESERVARAASGDTAAFDDLVRAHYPHIHTTAFHLLGNHEDAEDVAQDCFVRAHAALGWFRGARGNRSFATWLRRIVVHLVRDRFRKDGRRPEVVHLVPDQPAHAAHEPEREVGRRELGRLLADAVARLPENLRIALLLRTRDELSYDEIAVATGVTPSTARTQVMKARRALLRLVPSVETRREDR